MREVQPGKPGTSIPSGPSRAAGGKGSGRGEGERKGARRRKHRVPTTAAIAVTCTDKDAYGAIMRRARTEISVDDLDIPGLSTKRAVNGGIIF